MVFTDIAVAKAFGGDTDCTVFHFNNAAALHETPVVTAAVWMYFYVTPVH